MKKTKFMALLLMAGLTFTACDDDDDFKVSGEDQEKTVTVDFESSYFSAFIDTPQYGGSLLYGELAKNYRWTDPTTQLTGGMTNKWGGSYGFAEGGVAISNYLDDTLDSIHSFTDQLAVPVTNGSKNFAVVFDEGTLLFADSVAREVKSMDVIGTTYMLSVAKNGDGNDYARALTRSTDYLTVTVTGYKGAEEVGAVPVTLCAAGGYMANWYTLDLSSLGEVTSLKFTMDGSDKDEYGLKTPAYFALDNIVIKK